MGLRSSDFAWVSQYPYLPNKSHTDLVRCILQDVMLWVDTKHENNPQSPTNYFYQQVFLLLVDVWMPLLASELFSEYPWQQT